LEWRVKEKEERSEANDIVAQGWVGAKNKRGGRKDEGRREEEGRKIEGGGTRRGRRDKDNITNAN
jgi:hypothetical protein